MQQYKDLLNANQKLNDIEPKCSEKSSTYPPNEMFYIEETGARVSIDGSLDLINMLVQKLQTRYKGTKLRMNFEEVRNDIVMNFKCNMSLNLEARVFESDDQTFFTTKAKAKSYAALLIIRRLHSEGMLNDNLAVEFTQFSKKKQLEQKRKKMTDKFKQFKEENKQKLNQEDVSIEVETEFNINQSAGDLDGMDLQDATIIVFKPSSSNQYPFPSNKFRTLFDDQSSLKTIGFLADKNKLPKSHMISLMVRGEQIDRVRHFLHHTNTKFYQKSKNLKVNKKKNSPQNPVNNDQEIEYELDVQMDITISKDDLEKIKFFHVFMFTSIYIAEASFYEGLLNGSWVFNRLFKNTLKRERNRLIKSNIFKRTDYFTRGNFMPKDLCMFTIPVKDGGIDFDLIDQCVEHVKLKLMTFASTSELLKLKAADTPLLPTIHANRSEEDVKEKLIKFSVFDVITNGSKYFYHQVQPSYKLKERLQKVEKKTESPVVEQPNKPQSKYGDGYKKNYNIIQYYEKQYGYHISDSEEKYTLNQFTLPKENVKMRTVSVSLNSLF